MADHGTHAICTTAICIARMATMWTSTRCRSVPRPGTTVIRTSAVPDTMHRMCTAPVAGMKRFRTATIATTTGR